MKASLAIVALAFLPLTDDAVAQATARSYEIAGGAWHVPNSTVGDIRRQLQRAADGAVAASATKEKRSVLNDIIQYQGVFDEKSRRRLIEVWGMCETDWSPEMLRGKLAVGRDGGNCYYFASYDPSTKKFRAFLFNGAA